jgi:hypothetical protein
MHYISWLTPHKLAAPTEALRYGDLKKIPAEASATTPLIAGGGIPLGKNLTILPLYDHKYSCVLRICLLARHSGRVLYVCLFSPTQYFYHCFMILLKLPKRLLAIMPWLVFPVCFRIYPFYTSQRFFACLANYFLSWSQHITKEG